MQWKIACFELVAEFIRDSHRRLIRVDLDLHPDHIQKVHSDRSQVLAGQLRDVGYVFWDFAGRVRR